MGKLSSKIVKTQLKIRKPSSKSGKTQFLRLLLSVRNRVRCSKDKPAFCSQVLVHEVGHNLGMHHDFIPVPFLGIVLPRFSGLVNCNNDKFYMAYGRNPDQWSPCSVEDLTSYYNSILTESGSFCLPSP